MNGKAVTIDQRVAAIGVERQRRSHLERSDEFSSGGGLGIDEHEVVGLDGGLQCSGQQVVVKVYDTVGVAVVPAPGQPEVDVTDPGFWELGLKLLGDMVAEAEKLAAQLN